MSRLPALEIRTLRPDELAKVHELVRDAFAVYPVPMEPSFEELGRLVSRRGVDWSVSFGAFHEGQLIAATLTAIDDRPAPNTGAYDVLSAVRRKWQGKGVLTALFEWLTLALGRRDVTQMQLEVLIDNPRARQAYDRVGFELERHLFCFEMPRIERPQRFSEQLSFELHEGAARASELESERRELWGTWWSITPAWTNSNWTVARTVTRVIFEAKWEGEPCAYAILEPDSGELLQIAVDPKLRRRGIGTELLRACEQRSKVRFLKILNVDGAADYGVTIAFLRQLGAELTAVQLEMMMLEIR